MPHKRMETCVRNDTRVSTTEQDMRDGNKLLRRVIQTPAGTAETVGFSSSGFEQGGYSDEKQPSGAPERVPRQVCKRHPEDARAAERTGHQDFARRRGMTIAITIAIVRCSWVTLDEGLRPGCLPGSGRDWRRPLPTFGCRCERLPPPGVRPAVTG